MKITQLRCVALMVIAVAAVGNCCSPERTGVDPYFGIAEPTEEAQKILTHIFWKDGKDSEVQVILDTEKEELRKGKSSDALPVPIISSVSATQGTASAVEAPTNGSDLVWRLTGQADFDLSLAGTGQRYVNANGAAPHIWWLSATLDRAFLLLPVGANNAIFTVYIATLAGAFVGPAVGTNVSIVDGVGFSSKDSYEALAYEEVKIALVYGEGDGCTGDAFGVRYNAEGVEVFTTEYVKLPASADEESSTYLDIRSSKIVTVLPQSVRLIDYTTGATTKWDIDTEIIDAAAPPDTLLVFVLVTSTVMVSSVAATLFFAWCLLRGIQ